MIIGCKPCLWGKGGMKVATDSEVPLNLSLSWKVGKAEDKAGTQIAESVRGQPRLPYSGTSGREKSRYKDLAVPPAGSTVADDAAPAAGDAVGCPPGSGRETQLLAAASATAG
jgi:hypothetical protein